LGSEGKREPGERWGGTEGHKNALTSSEKKSFFNKAISTTRKKRPQEYQAASQNPTRAKKQNMSGKMEWGAEQLGFNRSF